MVQMPPTTVLRRLKLNDIRVLLAVVRAGSMSKAASVLNTTQSAISRTISDLENAIGVRLLDRSAQGVEPTSSGRALLRRGIIAFDELEQGLKEINFLNDPAAGELHFGAGPAQCEGIVLGVIAQLLQQYPCMIFHVAPLVTPPIYEELRQRRIEFGLVRISGALSEEDLEQEFLFEEPLVVMAHIDSPWARRRKLDLSKLLDDAWTWPDALDQFVVDAFRAKGLEPPRAAVYTDASNMRTSLAATGRFLAVVPASVARVSAMYAALKILPVALPAARLQIGIVTVKNRTLSPLARLFLDHTRKVASAQRTLIPGRLR
jgi:DNA-binding transcriptional LysR family regulator